MSTIRENLVARKVKNNNHLQEAKEVIEKTPFKFCIRGDWNHTVTGLSEFFSKGHPISISKDNMPDNWVNNNIPSQKTANLCKNQKLSKEMTPFDPKKAAEIVARSEEPEKLSKSPTLLTKQNTYS